MRPVPVSLFVGTVCSSSTGMQLNAPSSSAVAFFLCVFFVLGNQAASLSPHFFSAFPLSFNLPTIAPSYGLLMVDDL